jgi:hypothetical protein
MLLNREVGLTDRAVRKVTHQTLDGRAVTAEPSPAEKLLKYFPEAALVLYLTLDPIARELGFTTTVALGLALWVTLGICVVFCWLFLRRFWKVSDRQAWISIGAFVLYIAAIGGPFGTITGYKPLMGTAAAVIATAFLIFVPSEDIPAPPD